MASRRSALAAIGRQFRPLLDGWGNALATLVILVTACVLLPDVFEWSILRADWQPDAERCRALLGTGACWGVIVEKYPLILFGRYPFDQHWRPALACGLLLAALWLAGSGRLRVRPALALLSGALLGFLALLHGGGLGLPIVDSQLWGGLPLTLLLATGGMAGALPLGILLALGRRSRLPLLRSCCAFYIELVRGVPMISVLFVAAFLFPLFLPDRAGGSALWRVLPAIVGFAAAYLAEVVRGGLQSVPAGQGDAAAALGLSRWQCLRHVILPQALRAALPALVNTFIGLFKDVSLVTVVSLYELTGALTLALSGDAQWRAFYLEGYLFIGLIYWLGCLALSNFGRRLERRLQYSSHPGPSMTSCQSALQHVAPGAER
jgi:general L-amino acid transport system permease protein